MKRTVLPLSLLILVSWAVLQPAGVLDFSAPFFPLRTAFTALTGALALGWMGVSMLLALRPAWLERALGGLDKLYYVHKWVGIGAVLLVVTHWLLILSPRTLIDWGWVDAVARSGGRPHGPHGGGHGIAREMGEWAAWLMIVLGLTALLRFVPYDWFRKVHKGFPVAFLIGAYHSVMLLPHGSATTPFGLLMIAIALVGSLIALKSLRGAIGSERRHPGHIVGVEPSAAGVLGVSVDPGRDWPGHQCGQFALLTFDRDEGAHPFTIVSEWAPGAPLRFAIKPLGDYTRTLAERLRVGDAATIEGPYGRFEFGRVADSGEVQVWVAGGVGIASFMARLEELAANGNGEPRNIHLFYSVHSAQEAGFPKGLEVLCRRAGVTLHLRVTPRDGRLTADEIGQFVRGARGVWFCGPARWAGALRDVLCRDYGLARANFHRELFEFR